MFKLAILYYIISISPNLWIKYITLQLCVVLCSVCAKCNFRKTDNGILSIDLGRVT